MNKLMSYLGSSIFVPLFILHLLFIELLTLLFPKKAWEIETLLNKGIIFLLRATLGTKISYNYLGDTPLPAVIVSNHQSLFDIPLIATALPLHRPRFVAKKELSKGIPAVSRLLRVTNHIVIDRSNASEAIRVIKKQASELHSARRSIALFPEGTRAREGKMRPFRLGGIENMQEIYKDSYFIPVSIDGAWKLAKGFPIPFGEHVKVTIHPPIKGVDLNPENLHTIVSSNVS